MSATPHRPPAVFRAGRSAKQQRVFALAGFALALFLCIPETLLEAPRWEKRRITGVALDFKPAQLDADLRQATREHAIATFVMPSGPGERAGISVGDTVLTVSGIDVAAASVAPADSAISPSVAVLTYEIERLGIRRRITVPLRPMRDIPLARIKLIIAVLSGLVAVGLGAAVMSSAHASAYGRSLFVLCLIMSMWIYSSALGVSEARNVFGFVSPRHSHSGLLLLFKSFTTGIGVLWAPSAVLNLALTFPKRAAMLRTMPKLVRMIWLTPLAPSVLFLGGAMAFAGVPYPSHDPGLRAAALLVSALYSFLILGFLGWPLRREAVDWIIRHWKAIAAASAVIFVVVPWCIIGLARSGWEASAWLIAPTLLMVRGLNFVVPIVFCVVALQMFVAGYRRSRSRQRGYRWVLLGVLASIGVGGLGSLLGVIAFGMAPSAVWSSMYAAIVWPITVALIPLGFVFGVWVGEAVDVRHRLIQALAWITTLVALSVLYERTISTYVERISNFLRLSGGIGPGAAYVVIVAATFPIHHALQEGLERMIIHIGRLRAS